MANEVGNLVAKVTMDQTGFQQGVTKLNRELKIVQSEFKASSAQLGDFGKSTEGLRLKADSLTKQLELQKQKVAALDSSHKKSVEAKGADAKATQNLEIQLNKAKAQMAGTERELKKTTAELNQQSTAWGRLSKAAQDNAGKMVDLGKKMTTYVTLPLVALGAIAAKSAIDFESAFAGVRKTVDATEPEFAKLRQGFIDMSKEIPIATTELMKIGEAAGQLGIHKDAILGFTDVMAKLGVATNLSGEQAAMSLARLANIMQMPQSQFDRLGSTIVALGNNLATTEAEIVAMGLRLAGAGNITGMTEAQVLSLAGALSSVGIEAEAGGTAFSRVMLEMNNQVASGGEKLRTFASVAGMSVQQFSEMWRTNAAGALVAFIEGLGRIKESGQNVVPVLEELGMSEIRVRDALLRASGAGDLFARSLEIGSDAWDENIALNKEAEERFKTTESQLQILKNTLKIVAATFGDVLLPAINGAVGGLVPLLDRFSKLSDPVKKATIVLVALVAIFPPLILGVGMFIGLIPTLKVGLAALATGAKSLGGALIWLVTNPVGWVILGLAALVTAGVLVYKNWDTVKYYGLQAWGNLKVGVLKAIEAIASAYEKLYGWVPILGDKIRSAHAKIRQSILEEQAILENRIKPGSESNMADFRKLDQESVKTTSNLKDVKIAVDDLIPSFDDLGIAASGAGSKVGGAGKTAKKAAEETKAAWETAADTLSTHLSLIKAQQENAALAAEQHGDEAKALADKITWLNRQHGLQIQIVDAVKVGYQESAEAKGEDAEETMKLAIRLEQEKKAQAEIEKQIRETTKAIKDQSQQLRDLAEEVTKVETKYKEDLVAALDDYQRKVAETNRKVVEEERKLTEAYENEITKRAQSLRDFVGLFDAVTQKEVSGETLLENLRGQVDAFEDWQENIGTLAAKGVDQGLIDELRQMGPKAGPEIAALNTLTGDQLQEYVSLWRTKNEEARAEAVNQLQRQREEMQQKLSEIRAEASAQLEQYRIEWEKKNAEIRKNAEDEMNRIQEKFEGIAKAGTAYGVQLMQNFSDGMKSQFDVLRDTLEQAAGIVDSYMPHSPAKRGPLKRLDEWGPSLISGLIDGIKRSFPRLEDISSRMAMLSPGALMPAVANNYSTRNTYNQGGNTIVLNISRGWEEIERELAKRGVRF